MVLWDSKTDAFVAQDEMTYLQGTLLLNLNLTVTVALLTLTRTLTL